MAISDEIINVIKQRECPSNDRLPNKFLESELERHGFSEEAKEEIRKGFYAAQKEFGEDSNG